jgi:hypothetical protein
MFGCSGSTEIVNRRSTSKDKIVVTYFFTFQLDLFSRHIDAYNCSETKVHILLVSENAPHGRPNIFGIQKGSGYLIKERLECMIVVSVN